MTDEQKLQAVELALAGVKVEDIRDMAGMFSYARRTCLRELATLDDFRGALAGLLERDECRLLDSAVDALGPEGFCRLCTGVLDEYDNEHPGSYRSDYVRAATEGAETLGATIRRKRLEWKRTKHDRAF
jgi:hypothetical protein